MPEVFSFIRYYHQKHLLQSLRINQKDPPIENLTPANFSSDLYGVLGVSRSANKDQLRDAYWAIARKNHPDRNKVSLYK